MNWMNGWKTTPTSSSVGSEAGYLERAYCCVCSLLLRSAWYMGLDK
jgi:hypothetical protein